MTEQLRAAIVGYGLAGRHFHRPLLEGANFRVDAVVTRNPERRQQAEHDIAAVTVYDSPDEVWARADVLDLAVIASPPRTHLPLARAAIDSRLAVVVEKPFALDTAEAAVIAEEGLEHNVPVIPFHNRRWDADTLTLQRLLAEGALGAVWRHESRFERWRPHPRPGSWREELRADQGGGLLLDLGTHLVDQAIHLYGPADLAHVEVDARRGGADDDVRLVLRHDSGVISDLWASAVCAAPGPRLRVLGRDAALVVSHVDRQEEQLRAGLGATDPTMGVEDAGFAHLQRGHEVIAIRPERGAWVRFYDGVSAVIRTGAPTPVHPASAVVVMAILEEALRRTS